MTFPWPSETLLAVLIGGAISLAAQIVVAWVGNRAEHRQWLREERLTAYRALVTEWGRRYNIVGETVDKYTNLENIPLPEDYLEPLYDAIWDACLVASPKTAEFAWRAYKALLAVDTDGPSDEGPAAWVKAGEEFDRLRLAIRRDLGAGRDMDPPDFTTRPDA